jgi:beta-galactosidase
LPHWTWPGREGELTPVHCYTSAPKAELFVNGVSQGVREKDKQSEFDRYRLRWNDVIYQPGCLRVVAMDEKGSIEGEHELHTAGDASHIELQADRNSILADGKDLAFLTVSICDREGQLCPESDNMLSIDVTGGAMACICNGSAADETSFLSRAYPVYKGMAVIAVKSVQVGKICVTVSAENLSPANLDIYTVDSL